MIFDPAIFDNAIFDTDSKPTRKAGTDYRTTVRFPARPGGKNPSARK